MDSRARGLRRAARARVAASAAAARPARDPADSTVRSIRSAARGGFGAVARNRPSGAGFRALRSPRRASAERGDRSSNRSDYCSRSRARAAQSEHDRAAPLAHACGVGLRGRRGCLRALLAVAPFNVRALRTRELTLGSDKDRSKQWLALVQMSPGIGPNDFQTRRMAAGLCHCRR